MHLKGLAIFKGFRENKNSWICKKEQNADTNCRYRIATAGIHHIFNTNTQYKYNTIQIRIATAVILHIFNRPFLITTLDVLPVIPNTWHLLQTNRIFTEIIVTEIQQSGTNCRSRWKSKSSSELAPRDEKFIPPPRCRNFAFSLHANGAVCKEIKEAELCSSLNSIICWLKGPCKRHLNICIKPQRNFGGKIHHWWKNTAGQHELVSKIGRRWTLIHYCPLSISRGP